MFVVAITSEYSLHLFSIHTAAAADTIPNANPSGAESAKFNNTEAILAQVHDDFRRYLYLPEILPSLNKRSLLTPNEMETLQGMGLTNQDKVDKLLQLLPRKGNGMNVLGHLINCLHETKSGTGSAHGELAKKLEGEVTSTL